MWTPCYLVLKDVELSSIRESELAGVHRFWMVFSSGSGVKNPPAMQEVQETEVQSLGQEDPLEEGTTALSIILAGKIP